MNAKAAHQAASISQAVNRQPDYYGGENLSEGIEEKRKAILDIDTRPTRNRQANNP